jgi:hypothetical protein
MFSITSIPVNTGSVSFSMVLGRAQAPMMRLTHPQPGKNQCVSFILLFLRKLFPWTSINVMTPSSYCTVMTFASALVLDSLKASFYQKFEITTASGDRFLGTDTVYNRDQGYLKLSMTSYIETTVARFASFDLSCGVTFRELVGCLLWVTLCVLGPELLRVKDLARRSNSFTEADYSDAMKVLQRISERKLHGIVIYRNAATREALPAFRRPSPDEACTDDTGDIVGSFLNEVTLKSLCQAKAVGSLPTSQSSYIVPDDDRVDIPRVTLPVNLRYRLMSFGDASFAIGELKQSVSGFVVYLNGVPLLWGALKQTIVVDSSCSAEFVAASIVCKQILHAEHMIAFLGFCSPKPYHSLRIQWHVYTLPLTPPNSGTSGISTSDTILCVV